MIGSRDSRLNQGMRNDEMRRGNRRSPARRSDENECAKTDQTSSSGVWRNAEFQPMKVTPASDPVRASWNRHVVSDKRTKGPRATSEKPSSSSKCHIDQMQYRSATLVERKEWKGTPRRNGYRSSSYKKKHESSRTTQKSYGVASIAQMPTALPIPNTERLMMMP